MFTNKKAFLLGVVVLFSSVAQADTWSCNTGETVNTQNMGSFLLINDKYRAHYQGSCDASDGCGDRGGQVYANTGYTYKVYVDNNTRYLSVKNKWGKDATCQ